MKEFIEKLIGRLEEYQGKIKLRFGNRGEFDFMEVDAVKEIVKELAEEYKDKSNIIDDLKTFLQEKFDYCAEQAGMNLEAECNSEIASYFRNRKELYLDRANIYGEVMRVIDRLAEEYINTSTDTSSGWISVKDRLPTEEGSYLVVGKTGGATVTRWYMPNKFHQQGHFGGNSAEYIRYWMPRPQAPKYEPKENKTMTNADRIRSMTDEELAEFLDDLTDNCCRCAEHQNCGNCQIGLDAKTGFCDIKKWLQSEVEGVTENE